MLYAYNKLCFVYTVVSNQSLQVMCYGLSLPLTENDTIRDCIKVYCEWLSVLTSARACVPRPILDDPNPYVRTMLHHLYNLFVPRPDAGSTSSGSSGGGSSGGSSKMVSGNPSTNVMCMPSLFQWFLVVRVQLLLT